MSLLINTGHVAGSLLSSFAIFAFMAWMLRRSWTKRTIAEAECIGLELGLTKSEMNSDEHDSAIRAASLTRFSNDQLRNRVSDSIGTLVTMAGWLSGALQLVVIAATGWLCWKEGVTLTPLWFIPMITAMYALFVLFTHSVCLVATGRMPGQARAVRRALGLTM